MYESSNRNRMRRLKTKQKHRVKRKLGDKIHVNTFLSQGLDWYIIFVQ